MLIMHQLARILLDMDALDPDDLVFGDPGLLVSLDQQLPLTHDRVVKLADLVALRQIGIEVVLAIEPAVFVDLRLDRHAGAHRLADAFAIGHGQHARHRRIDKADLRVRLGTEFGTRAAEQLGVGSDLRMDFEADHDLPFARGALDAVSAHINSHVIPAKAGIFLGHVRPGGQRSQLSLG